MATARRRPASPSEAATAEETDTCTAGVGHSAFARGQRTTGCALRTRISSRPRLAPALRLPLMMRAGCLERRDREALAYLVGIASPPPPVPWISVCHRDPKLEGPVGWPVVASPRPVKLPRIHLVAARGEAVMASAPRGGRTEWTSQHIPTILATFRAGARVAQVL